MAFLAGLRTNEEQRLGDQIKEADEKRKAMEEAKAAKLHEGFLAAKAFNAAQTAANDEAKVRLFQEDRRNAEELKMKFKESMAEEAAKEEARRARVKKLQQCHIKQIEEKKHKMSLLQDETNEEIRDMERQFAVQVRLLLFAASRAIAFVCWCGIRVCTRCALHCVATCGPLCFMFSTCRAGRRVPGVRGETRGARASGGQEPAAHHPAAAEEHAAVACRMNRSGVSGSACQSK